MRFSELPQESWSLKLLCGIVSSNGMPTNLDATTRNKSFGHYAYILIDIDLSKPLHLSILVERDDFSFFVRVEYEKLPYFCDFFKSLGHTLPQCKIIVLQSHLGGKILSQKTFMS